MGISSRRLTTSFVRIFPGFHTPRVSPAHLEDVCRVLQEQVIPGAVISHTTAAALYGIPFSWHTDGGISLLRTTWSAGHERTTLFRSPGPAALRGSDADLARSTPAGAPDLCIPHLHCTVAPGANASAGPRVTVHRTLNHMSRTRDGLRISAPGQMLHELALLLPHEDVVIALDHVLGPTTPFGHLTREELRDRLEPYLGRRGGRRLLTALDDAREGVESPGETRTRLLLTRAGFPEPKINLPVTDPDTGRPRRLDLAYEDLQVAIEYDGDWHREQDVWREDHARQDSLESAGWAFRRLNAGDLAQSERFLDALRRTMLARDGKVPARSHWADGALSPGAVRAREHAARRRSASGRNVSARAQRRAA